MSAYLRSARFACGILTLLIGLAFVVGGLLLLRCGDADLHYYVFLGVALGAIAIVLALTSWLGLALYALMFAAALAWTLYHFGLDLWQLAPHLLALLLWGAILFAVRDRLMERPHHVGPVVRAGSPNRP
jgi:glucose dehydrogenase